MGGGLILEEAMNLKGAISMTMVAGQMEIKTGASAEGRPRSTVTPVK